MFFSSGEDMDFVPEGSIQEASSMSVIEDREPAKKKTKKPGQTAKASRPQARQHASKEASSVRRTETSPKRKVNCFRVMGHRTTMAYGEFTTCITKFRACGVSCTELVRCRARLV